MAKPRRRKTQPLKFALSGLSKPLPAHYWLALAVHMLLAALFYSGLLAWTAPVHCGIVTVMAGSCSQAGVLVHWFYLAAALAVTLPPAIYIRRWMTRRWPPKV